MEKLEDAKKQEVVVIEREKQVGTSAAPSGNGMAVDSC